MIITIIITGIMKVHSCVRLLASCARTAKALDMGLLWDVPLWRWSSMDGAFETSGITQRHSAHLAVPLQEPQISQIRLELVVVVTVCAIRP
jgi:hypothetical protein